MGFMGASCLSRLSVETLWGYQLEFIIGLSIELFWSYKIVFFWVISFL